MDQKISPSATNRKSAIHRAIVDLFSDSPNAAITQSDLAERLGYPLSEIQIYYPDMAAVWRGVAEEGMTRLLHDLVNAGANATGLPPVGQIEMIGVAYVQWAIENPVYFRVLHSRRLAPLDASEDLSIKIEAIRAMLERMVRAGQAGGQIDPSLDIPTVLLTMRALGYGLTRMVVDGHLPEWGIPDADPTEAARRAVSLMAQLFIERTGGRAS